MATLFSTSTELTTKTANNATPVALFDEAADGALLDAKNAGRNFVCWRVVCETAGMTICYGGNDITTLRGTLFVPSGTPVEIPTSEIPFAIIYAGGVSASIRVTAIT